MYDDLYLISNTLLDWLLMIWQAIGTWGLIGAFIIGFPVLRKIVIILKNLWKGGL